LNKKQDQKALSFIATALFKSKINQIKRRTAAGELN